MEKPACFLFMEENWASNPNKTGNETIYGNSLCGVNFDVVQYNKK